MKALAKNINKETGECWVALGTDEKFYRAQGFTELDVEQAYNGVWYLSGYAPAYPIDMAKKEKLAEINNKYEVATSALVSTYPDIELLTFDKQESEARAWKADNSAGTPFLDGLALARGIDKAELVDRVIIKAESFQTAVATLTGLRQRYEDQLSMATTVEEISVITPVYNV